LITKKKKKKIQEVVARKQKEILILKPIDRILFFLIIDYDSYLPCDVI